MPLQYRHKTAVLDARTLPWDIAEGPDGLLRWMARFGRLNALVVMAGVTPATGADMSLNIRLAQAYLQAAAGAGIGRVLLASSSLVYGAGDGTPMAETTPCRPMEPYGQSKLDMENMAARMAQVEGLEVCCLRIGNVAGAESLLGGACEATAAAPMTIEQFPDGRSSRRSYIGPVQAGDMLARLAICPGPLPAALNFAGIAPVYMDDLATAARIPWRFVPAPEGRQQTRVLDCTALSRLIRMPAGTGDPKTIAREWRR
jgi:nucleoside-diphosphate-sugar epimerase